MPTPRYGEDDARSRWGAVAMECLAVGTVRTGFRIEAGNALEIFLASLRLLMIKKYTSKTEVSTKAITPHTRPTMRIDGRPALPPTTVTGGGGVVAAPLGLSPVWMRI